tara:strand:+ start:946 stop:1875 length:930 start_codon:yes stop_codon:yes gene_type:complete
MSGLGYIRKILRKEIKKMKKTEGKTIIHRLKGLLQKIEDLLDVEVTSLNKKRTKRKWNVSYWNPHKTTGKPVISEFVRIYNDMNSNYSFAFAVQNFGDEERIIVTCKEERDGEKLFVYTSKPYTEDDFKEALKAFLKDVEISDVGWLNSLMTTFEPLVGDEAEFVRYSNEFTEKFGELIKQAEDKVARKEELDKFVPDLQSKVNSEIKKTKEYKYVVAIEEEIGILQKKLVQAKSRLNAVRDSLEIPALANGSYGEITLEHEKLNSYIEDLHYKFDPLHSYLLTIPAVVSARIKECHPIISLGEPKVFY